MARPASDPLHEASLQLCLLALHKPVRGRSWRVRVERGVSVPALVRSGLPKASLILVTPVLLLDARRFLPRVPFSNHGDTGSIGSEQPDARCFLVLTQ